MKLSDLWSYLHFALVLLLHCYACEGGASGEVAAEKRPALWVDALRGEPIEFDEMLDDLQTARVVYLGEYHTIARHHELEKRVLEGLINRGAKLVLAMEQFEFFNQPVLDRFNQGTISLDELIQEANLPKRWTGYTNYMPLLASARAHQVLVLALNARAETIRAVGRGGGISKLSREQRSELPDTLQVTDPMYEKLLTQVLGVHMAFDTARLKPAFEAQVARDETMASRLAQFLTSPEGRDCTAVVVCGRGHCEYGLGTPSRMERRIPKISQRVVLFSESGDLQLSEQERKQAREVEITHAFLQELGKPAGDYFQATALRQR